MEIKVKFENGHFVPLGDIEKMKNEWENKEIRIEIIPKIEDLVGVLKGLNTDSVSLQLKIKEMW